MPTQHPKVSIGLPVYNGERFIAGAIESLLDQTFGDFELIISDNASTDGTGKVCRAFAEQDSRIRYVRQPENLGAIPNFNGIFDLARGQYFKWAAVDDKFDRTFLAKAVEQLDRNPAAVWCHSRTSHIDANGRLLEEPGSQDVSYPDRQSDCAAKRFRSVLLGEGGCHDVFGLIRSDALRKTPLYLPCYGAEKVLVAELALLGRYVEIPETLFFCGVVDQASSNLRTAAEQRAFIITRASWKHSFTRLMLFSGHLNAIRRSAPSVTVALKCLGIVLQWLFQISKWKSVVLKTLRREGVGGRNIERIERINKTQNREQEC